MDAKHKGIIDTAASAAGGLAGASLGALAGPEVSLIAGATGSFGAYIAINYAPDILKGTILRRFLNNRKIVGLLKGKIAADISCSFLGSQVSFNLAMEAARETINAANRNDKSIGNLESRLHRYFRWNLPQSEITNEELNDSLQAIASYCEKAGPIKIACAAICSAFAGLFRHLEGKFGNSHGLRFHLYNSASNGSDLFSTLRTACDYDFVIGPLEVLVQNDRDRILPLRVIGPVFGERQWVFVSTKRRRGIHSGVWVFARSTADMHYIVGHAVPRSAEKQTISDFRQMPSVIESMPPGDLIIAWDPLAQLFFKHQEYTMVPQSEFLLHFFLYGHKRVFNKRSFPLDAFLAILLAEWRLAERNQAPLLIQLRKDTNFMNAFAIGCGYLWTPEI